MTAAAGRRLAAGEHRVGGVPAVSWRLSFYDGWVVTVGQRLEAARQRSVAAQDARPAEVGSTSAALVLRAKGDRVRDFYASASQARGSWRGPASGRSRVSGRAFRAGQDDGARADLGHDRLRQRGRLEA
jgi:hypothetical protein